MLYPIAIALGDEKHAHGVFVPDIPGCFSAADEFQDVYTNAIEAITDHIELLVEDGEEIPQPSDIRTLQENPEYEGMIWGVVDVDLSHLLGKSEKINITLPSRLIRRIDAFVAEYPQYKSRSGFLAKVATDRIFATT